LDTFRNVRLYISTDFICTEKGLFVEPIYKSRSCVGDGIDSYLSDCKKRGITATLCINQSPAWMQGRIGEPNDAPPILPGTSRVSPASYGAIAGVFGQLAKRYGKVKHPDSELRVDPTSRWTNDGPNVKKSGLNYPVILEVWNEPDKWWNKGTPVYFEPQEYAAMLLACYSAIKAADSSMPVAMGGLTNFDLDYLNAMDLWFKENNGGAWPCDIINVHHYSNVANEYGKYPPTWNPSGGCSPADDKDFTRVPEVIRFARDRGKKACVSEFGYDTRPPSWQHILPKDGKTAEQLQGEYLIASYKAYLAAGIDVAFAYTAGDEYNAANGGLWQNAGILYGEGEAGKKWQPKPAYNEILKFIGQLK
jgi:hypothetical protein